MRETVTDVRLRTKAHGALTDDEVLRGIMFAVWREYDVWAIESAYPKSFAALACLFAARIISDWRDEAVDHDA